MLYYHDLVSSGSALDLGPAGHTLGTTPLLLTSHADRKQSGGMPEIPFVDCRLFVFRPLFRTTG